MKAKKDFECGAYGEVFIKKGKYKNRLGNYDDDYDSKKAVVAVYGEKDLKYIPYSHLVNIANDESVHIMEV